VAGRSRRRSHLLDTATVDLTVDSVGLDPNDLCQVREVYNVAGAYAFG